MPNPLQISEEIPRVTNEGLVAEDETSTVSFHDENGLIVQEEVHKALQNSKIKPRKVKHHIKGKVYANI